MKQVERKLKLVDVLPGDLLVHLYSKTVELVVCRKRLPCKNVQLLTLNQQGLVKDELVYANVECYVVGMRGEGTKR